MNRLARIARYIRLRFAASEAKVKHISEKYGLPPEDVASMGQADPSGGKYLEWIARRVKDGNIRWPEDSSRTQTALQDFKDITQKKNTREQYGVDPNLQKYTLHALEDISDKFHGRAGEKPASMGNISDDVRKVFDNGVYAIFKPATVEAACSIASGTKWCTADPEIAQHYLGGKGLFIIYRNGKKYAQADAGSQLMDLQDWPLKDDELVLILVQNEILPMMEAVVYAGQQRGMKPWPALEDIILENGDIRNALHYANWLVGGRVPKFEDLIAQDGIHSWMYATDSVKGRFPKGEAKMALLDGISLAYARDTIKGRFPEGEAAMRRNEGVWNQYIVMLIREDPDRIEELRDEEWMSKVRGKTHE